MSFRLGRNAHWFSRNRQSASACASRAAILLLLCATALGCIHLQHYAAPILPEQQTIRIRCPEAIMPAPLPRVPPPETVTDPQPNAAEMKITLDEAIRIAIQNSEVVRVLGGVTAVSTGRTIYDTAIANTAIDQEQGRFDPVLNWDNVFDRNEIPVGVFDPFDISGTSIIGSRQDGYRTSLGLSQTNILGGTTSLTFTDNRTTTQPGIFPLNPENRHSITLGYTQPLLAGAGPAANIAPITIARINTERTFYQFKSSLQDSVQSVIAAYWALVFARTDERSRRNQVKQGSETVEFASVRLRLGITNRAELSQAQTALAGFNASHTAAKANVIQREAALKNILGLPPTGTPRLVPTTPPTRNRLHPDWDKIVQLAEEARPDLIELKLLVELGQERLTLARNNALPRVDASTFYRWNGLDGKTPTRDRRSTEGSEFTDWSLGVNLAVPLGRRQGRAAVREQMLALARDRANLEQGAHAAIHDLATSTRNLAQSYALYEANKQARAAAAENLEQQRAEFRNGKTIIINLLNAVTDFGNAVSAEAQSLTQYNTELANLERETGTILETHQIVLYEEGMLAPGPLHLHEKCYPAAVYPGPNADVYPSGTEPAENFFDLEDPEIPRTGATTREKQTANRKELNSGINPPGPPPPRIE